MSAQHTPAPWGFDTVQTSCGICHRIGPFPAKREGDKPKHACVYVDYPSLGGLWEKQMEANARLIAAAPELLRVAELLVDWLNEEPGAHKLCDTARAAIARATGASTPT